MNGRHVEGVPNRWCLPPGLHRGSLPSPKDQTAEREMQDEERKVTNERMVGNDEPRGERTFPHGCSATAGVVLRSKVEDRVIDMSGRHVFFFLLC